MKTLFYKDLRENFKLALIGAAIVTLMLVFSFRSSLGMVQRIAMGQTNMSEYLQPLLAPSLAGELTFFCAIFGMALGWLQTRNEAHRDLWAFLIHRPVTRTEIFGGKVLAGLCLYALGAGLPLLGVIWYAAQPGHVAAPFEWAMTLPIVAVFLTGTAYYFAGLLTGLRQARWFGSRVFGVGAAVLASATTFDVTEFWQALAVIVLVTTTLAIAVWGAYQSGGFYRGQAVAGKLALTACLTVGTGLAGLLGMGLMIAPFFQGNQDNDWRYYCMTRDGQVWVVSSHDGDDWYTDLDGKLLMDPVTGRKEDSKKFNENFAYGTSVFANFDRQITSWDRYSSGRRYFMLWSVSNKILWYVDRHGKLTGFNSVTRRHAGDLIPQNATGETAFIHAGYWYNYFSTYDPPAILATAHTVYRVNLDERQLTPILTTPGPEPIAGFGELKIETNAVVVTTRSTIQIIGFDGGQQLTLPYQPDGIAYPQIEVTCLEHSNRFAVWFHPNMELNKKAQYKMPVHVIWISKDNAVAKTADLPYLPMPSYQSPLDNFMNCLVPPALQFLLTEHRLELKQPACLIPSGLCVLAGWYFIRRNRFSGGAAMGWLLYIFLLGIPALLAFLCAQDWPQREACPGCKKLRTVDREKCEHCEAGFAPPEKIGIEIFEPLRPV